MNKYTFTIFFLLTSHFATAQYQIGLIPRESPDKAVYQKVGYTGVEIRYGSPSLQNRQVWGALVPYDQVWRAGANNATTVELTGDISINNMQLDSGKYALFMIPRENDQWTIIFNKNHSQWGAFRYNEADDALRVDIIPGRTQVLNENLSYTTHQTGYKFGSIQLNWEYMEIEIPFETHYIKQFREEVEARAKEQPEYLRWIVFLQGAEHLENIRSNQELAMSWIHQAEKIMDSTSEWNDQFYPRDYTKGHLYWTKAKLLAQDQKFQQAISYAEKVKSLENLIFYERRNEEENIDDLLTQWKGQ